jgi:ribosomal protein L15E
MLRVFVIVKLTRLNSRKTKEMKKGRDTQSTRPFLFSKQESLQLAARAYLKAHSPSLKSLSPLPEQL